MSDSRTVDYDRLGRLPEAFRNRTKAYAASVIRFYAKLPPGEVARTLGRQLLRSGTSVAAHVREASRARSDAEFTSKLGGAIQETDESLLWIELLSEECEISSELSLSLESEASELIAIMITMIRRTENEGR